MGDVTADRPVSVRVHTHSLAEDVFGILGSENSGVVGESLRMIAEAGEGALLYLHNGTRGFAVDRAVEPPRIVPVRDAVGTRPKPSRPKYR